MASLYRISWAGQETRHSRRYGFDNATRGGERIFVVQRTISGIGFIKHRDGRDLVRANHAMLFWHGQDTSYGYADECKGAYVLEFLAMTGPQCEDIFREILALAGHVLPLPRQSEAGRLFADIQRRFQERLFQDPLQESLQLYEFLISLWREAARIPAERDPVVSAANYIERRYHQPITMEEVARAVGLSREHLTRQLTRHWGESPGKRLQELRLQAGKDLVCNTTAPIEAIGQHCGYLDPDAFARAFARRFKMSPGKFRQRRQARKNA